jgi:hypothetical protein
VRETTANDGGTIIVDASERRWSLEIPDGDVSLFSFGAYAGQGRK